MPETSSFQTSLTDRERAEVETARAAARARFAHFADDDGDASGVVDPDNPPMTDADLARLRPAAEVVPALVAASLRRRSDRSRSAALEDVTPLQAEPSTRLITQAIVPVETGSAEETIAVYEERLDIGKRAVSRGRVRVRTSVVSREVSEDVTLHGETVTVDRRIVDRPVSAALDGDLFRERTIELEEFVEEVVVAKSAHLVEEIALRKESTDRVDTVHETLRSTKVDVEDDRTGKVVTGGVDRLAAEIRDGMEIVGSDGVHVGTVDHIDGDRIRLRRAGAVVGGEHHYLTRAMVKSIADRVTLAVTADEAQARWVMA